LAHPRRLDHFGWPFAVRPWQIRTQRFLNERTLAFIVVTTAIVAAASNYS
jgi:hypothetical protein